MTCEKCGNKNVDWASYCTQCGKPFGRICNCNFSNQPDSQFCGGCGIALKGNHPSKKSSSKQDETFVRQLSPKEISDLLQESIYFKVDIKDKLAQSDIDNIFAE